MSQTNLEGLTYQEWLNAAKYSKATKENKKAWINCECPCEHRAVNDNKSYTKYMKQFHTKH